MCAGMTLGGFNNLNLSLIKPESPRSKPAGWWMRPAALRWPRAPAQSAWALAAARWRARAVLPAPMPARPRPAGHRVRVLPDTFFEGNC